MEMEGEGMSLTDDLVAASAGLPVRLAAQKNGSLKGEAVLAERKASLSKRKLTYTCKARVDYAARTVRFWEMLVEKGSGMSRGMDDVGPGIGFKAGTYKTGGKERSGSIGGGTAARHAAHCRGSATARQLRFSISTGVISSPGSNPHTRP
jgi:hypothetical protein